MTNLLEVFPWNKNFETGIPKIDEQHQKLAKLINQLANNLGDSEEQYDLHKILDELTDYAEYHFESEEKIWAQSIKDKSILENLTTLYRDQHSNFLKSIHKIQQNNITEPTKNTLEDILSFLTHWLAYHILESDMRMSKMISLLKTGISVDAAKQHADLEMTSSMKLMLETTLSMYDYLCIRTVDLKKEINERIKIEENLREAASVFDNALEAICIMDIHEHVISANPAFYKSSGYSPKEVLGQPLRNIKSGLRDDRLMNTIRKHLNTESHWRGEINNRNKLGEIQAEWLSLSATRDSNNKIISYISMFSNISHLIKDHAELKYNAHHDALTKLPNRLLLTARLEQAIADATRKTEQFAVCYLDLDGFKPVNDNYGHDVGDLLLCEVSRRIKDVIRGNDTVARMGGDEFVVLFSNLSTHEDCKVPLDRLLNEISAPMDIRGNIHHVSASIGVAFYPDDAVSSEELLHHADQAMYRAKNSGKSQYKLHINPNN